MVKRDPNRRPCSFFRSRGESARPTVLTWSSSSRQYITHNAITPATGESSRQTMLARGGGEGTREGSGKEGSPVTALQLGCRYRGGQNVGSFRNRCENHNFCIIYGPSKYLRTKKKLCLICTSPNLQRVRLHIPVHKHAGNCSILTVKRKTAHGAVPPPRRVCTDLMRSHLTINFVFASWPNNVRSQFSRTITT